jgi:hypothetical protein
MLRNPIAGIVDCCARAASGHAAAPPSSVTKSRRRILCFPCDFAHQNTKGDWAKWGKTRSPLRQSHVSFHRVQTLGKSGPAIATNPGEAADRAMRRSLPRCSPVPLNSLPSGVSNCNLYSERRGPMGLSILAALAIFAGTGTAAYAGCATSTCPAGEQPTTCRARAYHFALHDIIERNPSFFHLWSKCRTKLLFQPHINASPKAAK